MSGTTLRPGVFSSYTAASSYSPRTGTKTIALLGAFGEPYHTVRRCSARPYDVPASPALLGELASVLFSGGTPSFIFVSQPETPAAEDTAAALSALDAESFDFLVCCAGAADTLAAVKTWVSERSLAQKETVAFAGASGAAAAQTLARGLNCERFLLVCPAGKAAASALASPAISAAALAGALAVQTDPAASFSGMELPGLTALEALSAQEIEALLAAGVTPLEMNGSAACCVRALTTRTLTDGVSDRTFAPANTILIIDHVMKTLREGLRLLLRGARNDARTLSAVGTQTAVLLESLKDAGVLSAYASPQVYSPAGDPETCVVEISFAAAYIVNQIHISAHIAL